MEPTLYFRPGTCALSEMILLEWIGEPYRAVRVEKAQTALPGFRALSPHGTVPVMRFGDLVVYENNALIAHLADTHPEAKLLPPAGTPERAIANQWMSYLDSGFHVAHYPLFKASKFAEDESLHPMLGEVAKKRVAEHLGFVNTHLEELDFFLLGHRTALDAYFTAIGRWARRWFDYADQFPAVDRFLLAMDEDEGVRRAKAIEAGEIEAPSGALQALLAFEA